MAWLAVAGSSHPDAAYAISESIGQLVEALGDGSPPDLAMVFAAGRHGGELARASRAVTALLGAATVIGANSEAVILGPSVHHDAIALGVLRCASVLAFGVAAGADVPPPRRGETVTLLMTGARSTLAVAARDWPTGHRLIGARISGGRSSAMLVDGAVTASGSVGVHLGDPGVGTFLADAWDPHPEVDGLEPGSDLREALTSNPAAAVLLRNRARRADLWGDPSPDAAIVHEATVTGAVIGMITSGELALIDGAITDRGPAAVGLLIAGRERVA